jgi:hypothetical protein
MKEKLIVTTEDGHRLALGSLLRKCRGVRTFRAALGRDDASAPLWLNFAARRLQGGELLIVATDTPARAALAAYRKRWAIECLFGDTKTQLASTSRTPGSSRLASSPCSSASSPSRSPGPRGPQPR